MNSSVYAYPMLHSVCHLNMYLYVFLTFLGSLPLLLFSFACFLILPSQVWQVSPGNQVSQVHYYYYVSIPNLSSLQLFWPGLVLVSPFFRLWLLFMFWGVSLLMLLMIQLSLPSDTIYLESLFGMCLMGVLWVLSSHLSLCNVCVCVCVLCICEITGPVWMILPLWKWPLTIKSLFDHAPRSIVLLLLVYCICVSCCAFLTCQFS